MFAVASIATATQQTITLHRFRNHPGQVRRVLGQDENVHSASHSMGIRVFVWQIPVMMLRFSIYSYLAGLLIFLWHAALVGKEGEGGWDYRDFKVAVIFTAVGLFAGFCHGLSVYFCYW